MRKREKIKGFNRLNELAGTMGTTVGKSLTGKAAETEAKLDAGNTAGVESTDSKKCNDLLHGDTTGRVGLYDRCVQDDVEKQDAAIDDEKENQARDNQQQRTNELIDENRLRLMIRNILLEGEEDPPIMGEPDLSAEEDRDLEDEDIDEVNTVAAAGISGAPNMPMVYDPERPDYSIYKKNK